MGYRAGGGMRPARIVTAVADEDQQQVKRQRREQEPLCFSNQPRQPGGQRRRAAFLSCGQSYSGSMIVSRRTMLEPRISM